MDTFTVVTWTDALSDGSTSYAAWCSYVLGVWGQGDTEDEALADILSAMAANVFDPWPADAPVFQERQVADAEMAQLYQQLDAGGFQYRLHHVTRSDLQAVYQPALEPTPAV